MENIFAYVDNFARYTHIKSELVWGSVLESDCPHITIAIPTYKRPQLLEKALFSALNQKNAKNYEIIIVDNNDDKTRTEVMNLIERFNDERILYYRNEQNIGMFGNWNRCIELARGKWLTILNDDDWLEPNYLEEVGRILEYNRVDALFVRYSVDDQRINEKKRIKSFKERMKNLVNKFLSNIMDNNSYRKMNEMDFFIGAPSMGSLGVLMKKNEAVKLGGFNEKYYPASDFYFFAKMGIENQSIMINQNLANYRILENESFEVSNLFPECDLRYQNFRLNYLKLSFFKKMFLILLSKGLYAVSTEANICVFSTRKSSGILSKRFQGLLLLTKLFLIIRRAVLYGRV